MTDLVFFYGTLMGGHSRGSMHTRMGVEFVGAAKIRGTLLTVHDSFPAYVEGDGEILGEVWRLPADPRLRARAVAEYDSIEGYHPRTNTGMYLRVERQLLDDPEGRTVSVYLWNREMDLWKIPSGSWAQYAPTIPNRYARLMQDERDRQDDAETPPIPDDDWEGWAA